MSRMGLLLNHVLVDGKTLEQLVRLQDPLDLLLSGCILVVKNALLVKTLERLNLEKFPDMEALGVWSACFLWT